MPTLPHLPIQEIVPSVQQALAEGNTLIVEAPPGAGKSTLLPLELLDAPWLAGQRIIMLEPRRLAAKAVASRMAELLGEKVGERIGYAVRFDRKVGKNTRLEVVTEGILTRRMQQDNALEGVGMVIFDEFHERSLHADLALALCRESQQVLREDLRILLMSATLDGQALAELLEAPVLRSQGRQYPIDIRYEEPDEQAGLHEQVAKAIFQLCKKETGDLLVFLPGAGEIRRTESLLLEHLPADIKIQPLYGSLSWAQQQAAIIPDRAGKRKVVLSTPIAETSLTIEGIRIVVDSGYARVPRFDPRSGLTRLETQRITLDAAKQRAGRAGRLGPGICLRLWTPATQHKLEAQRTPEILEADLAPLLLELANWGNSEPEQLAWLTPPPEGALGQAQTLLQELGALAPNSLQITERGKKMLRLPTHPRLAHMLLESKNIHLASLACELAALLEERDPMPRDTGADLTLRVEAYRRWQQDRQGRDPRWFRIDKLVKAWYKLLHTQPAKASPKPSDLGLLLAYAYPDRIGKQTGPEQPRYQLANGRMATLQKHDLLLSSGWIVVADLDAGRSAGRIFLAAPVNPDDLWPLVEERRVLEWDAQEGRLVAQKVETIGKLVLKEKPLQEYPEEEKLTALQQAVQDNPLLLDWDKEVESWMARVGSLKAWRPEEGWPETSQEALLARAEDWLTPFLSQVKKEEHFKKIRLLDLLPALLSYEQQQQLDRLAPARLEVPSGSSIRLQYSADASPPVLAVRIQELFGLTETPKINQGRQAVLIHLLSPGFKPVQVTQDLHSFWENTYEEVRKELRRRYSKHHWPEDPWTAEAVRGAKRRKRK